MYASMMTDELEMDIFDCLALVKSWGFRYVDLRKRLFGEALEDMEFSSMIRLMNFLKSKDMKCAMLHTSIGKEPDPEDKDVMKKQMTRAENIITASDILESKDVRLFPLCPKGFDDFGNLDEKHPWWDRILTLNEPVFRKLASAGCRIAVENAAFHINDALNIVKAFSKYNVCIAWDLMGGWILRDQAEETEQYISRIAPYIGNIHVKMFAYPGYEHNFEMSEKGKTAGIIPWKKLLAAIREAGNTGPLSVETQQVLILENAPSMLEANRMLAEFVLNIADEA